MMNIRWITAGIAAGGVLLLSGCVAVPGSYGYDNAYYSQPSYYGEGAPAVAPSVYIQGGTYYDRGYYNRGYYEARDGRDWRDGRDGRSRGYDGGRRNEGREPDRGPRPSVNPRPRPNVNIPGQSPHVTGYPPFQSPADRAAQNSGPRTRPGPTPGDQP